MLSATSNDSLSLSLKGLQSHGKIEPMHKIAWTSNATHER